MTVRTLWEHAQKKVAPDASGGHALSNVELTIDDGVNVASGHVRHAGWMVV
jgi:hypothetical protein